MNKLRLIKIYELRGEIHPIEAIVIDILDGIKEFTYSNDIDYMKKGYFYFSYNKKNNHLFLDSHIYKLFKCSEEETEEIMKYLLEKHLKIKIDEVW